MSTMKMTTEIAMGAPHWPSILPLTNEANDAAVEDAVFLGEHTLCDAIAWSCTLVPEGEPAMDKAAIYVERFQKVASRIRERSSVRQGFLIQATIGHGWVPGRATSWQKVIFENGNETYRFCPLGREFREYVAGQLKTLAAAKPDFFLVDDDTKLLSSKFDGCFCPLHLAEFAKQTGRTWTREELVAAMEAGDEALAAKWRAFSEATLVDYTRLIRSAFPETIPGTICATCGPAHRMGYITKCEKVLAGAGMRQTVRISGAPYWSDGLFDILFIRRLVAHQLLYLGDDVDALIEADTCPQTRLRTSATRALDYMLMFSAEGCCGAKMWWHRLGNPHERRSSSAYLRELKAKSGAIRWVADSKFTAGGIWCPAEELITDWGTSVFGRLGIAYHYGKRRAGDIAALTASSSEILDDQTITEILSGSVLLDGSAAIALTERGFGDLIGVHAKPWAGKSVSFEDMGDAILSSSTGAGAADLSDRAKGSEEVSRLFNRVSPLAEETEYLAPGSVLYTNRLGGRVLSLSPVVTQPPFKLLTLYYFSETRKAFLIKQLSRLGGTLPGGVAYLGDESVLCEAGKTKDGENIFILDSLELDVIENPELRFEKTPSSIDRLTDDGNWEGVEIRISDDGAVLILTTLYTHRPAVFRLTK